MARIASQDQYFKKAKAQGYPARSVYKLEEIDRRARLLKPGGRVLDLGASPGSWSQYAARRVGPRGVVVAVDLKPPAHPIKGVTWLWGDVTEMEAITFMEAGGPFDLVASDMAPATTGQKDVDGARSLQLAAAAFRLAGQVLKPSGQAVVKVFMGADFPELLKMVRQNFAQSRTIKPKASLKESRETYILAQGPVNCKEG